MIGHRYPESFPVAALPVGKALVDALDFRRIPKVLLHEHLDGGLRPETILELATEHRYSGLPTTDAAELALAIVLEEGLEARFERHKQMHLRLRAGLEAMGISYVPKHSLHTLNCIHIPDGVDDMAVRTKLLEEYNLEIGSGLGPFAGKAWRSPGGQTSN